MSQLPADCLNGIFEYLDDDKFTLHSCLLVNRLWCEVSVRILWRDGCDYSIWNYYTLIACLPNDSKEVLHNNGIIIPTPTSKPPIFNYAAFCKVLSTNRINFYIELLLKNQNQQSNSLQNLYDNVYIVAQEIFKLYMSQIASLKELYFYYNTLDIIFTSYPGAKDCLRNLSELCCSSNLCPEFFYQLSQICYNIQSLDIEIKEVISNGLTDLISVQKNLKYLCIMQCTNLTNIVPSLTTKLPNTLIKLHLYGGNYYISLLFITKFTNLQELELSFSCEEDFSDFGKLQYAIFPQLQILKIRYAYPGYKFLFKFLENNGKNLKEFYVGDITGGYSDNLLNLAIANFCPNLKKLSTGFKNNELETLKIVFNNCQYLESINIWCGGDYYLSEKEALNAVLTYSSKNFCELILRHVYYVQSVLYPEELEFFLISWSNHVPKRSKLSLIIINIDGDNSLDSNDENMMIIKKYIKLGVIKKFKVTYFEDFSLKD